MSDILKCPFCGGILEQSSIYNINAYACTDLACKGYFMTATKDMWNELIRTRKALDIAKNAINSVVDHNIINCVARGIDPRTDDTSVTLCNALEQIIALEQKG